jgi:hypothetical protein
LLNTTSKGFIYYQYDWFGIEFMNLLLLNYSSRLVNRNDTTTYLTTKLARVWKLSQRNDNR